MRPLMSEVVGPLAHWFPVKQVNSEMHSGRSKSSWTEASTTLLYAYVVN